MKIAVLGAGFTGLAAALRLLQQGHQVSLFDKEKGVGGLASGFKEKNWEWTLEQSYHHWFTNDRAVLNLAQELNYPIATTRPKTEVFIGGKISQFDNPLSILTSPYLSLPDKLRTGLAAAFLKYGSNYKWLEGKRALPWVRKYMGNRVTSLVWEPLFQGKFGKFKEDIALTWFWARIKKRTPSLAYPEGGFQSFAEKLAEKIRGLGGEICLGTKVTVLQAGPRPTVQFAKKTQPRSFDKVIVTLPSPVFTSVTPGLPQSYVQRINSLSHLHAQSLILLLNKPFMDQTYWLNITDKDFPFLVLAEHTNFMDKKYYGNRHILYVGNYLPANHPYLKMSAEKLLKIFDPYLRQINPAYQQSLITDRLFTAPFAQPVVTVNYSKLIPEFQSPLKNIYVSNLDMVYPWDRGVNYAVEMGEKIAKLVSEA